MKNLKVGWFPENFIQILNNGGGVNSNLTSPMTPKSTSKKTFPMQQQQQQQQPQQINPQ